MSMINTASTEEVARFFYSRAVPIPNWDKEQNSYKYRFYTEAEKFMNELAKVGLTIAKLPPVETKELPPVEEELPFTDPPEEEDLHFPSFDEGPKAIDWPTAENDEEEPKRSRRGKK